MGTLQDIVNKEMSRKELSATVGFGIASLFSTSTIPRFSFGKQQLQPASYGYGSSVYDGIRPKL